MESVGWSSKSSSRKIWTSTIRCNTIGFNIGDDERSNWTWLMIMLTMTSRTNNVDSWQLDFYYLLYIYTLYDTYCFEVTMHHLGSTSKSPLIKSFVVKGTSPRRRIPPWGRWEKLQPMISPRSAFSAGGFFFWGLHCLKSHPKWRINGLFMDF